MVNHCSILKGTKYPSSKNLAFETMRHSMIILAVSFGKCAYLHSPRVKEKYNCVLLIDKNAEVWLEWLPVQNKYQEPLIYHSA